ncbi:hypothetical protein AgCh_020404 [Apium graveolens]
MSRDSAVGYGVRSHFKSSKISYEGVDFSQSSRLNKVLQDQETFLKRPYGRSLNVNLKYGDPRCMEGVRAISDGTGWPSITPRYGTCVRFPTSLVKMSSPSVSVFHQSNIAGPKFGAISSVNSRENLETSNHGSFAAKDPGTASKERPRHQELSFGARRRGSPSLGLGAPGFTSISKLLKESIYLTCKNSSNQALS